MSDPNADVAKVLMAIGASIGLKESWLPYPGGHPEEVEAALLDSVFSLMAVYGSSGDVGPRAVVKRWRKYVGGRSLNSLATLVVDVDRAGGPDAFPSIVRHNGVAVPNAKDQPTKAAAVYGAACTLVAAGLDSAEDVRVRNAEAPKELHRLITRERGVGDAAATYFLMLLGVAGVKADVMIQRFVARAVGEDRVEPSRSQTLLARAAAELDADLLTLDHALWSYESQRSRKAGHGSA